MTVDASETLTCPACGAAVLDIDVKCAACGKNLASTGAHRLVGTIVLGQYELVDVLGQGGMSVVYKGKHKLTEQEVALKILPPELAAHAQVKSRFLEEAKALAQMDHPNIVHLYNFGQENGCFVLAMQYVHGRTWERMIIEAQRLDWTTSTRIAVDVLRALEYAHGRGIVHRDMKPSNVLVRDDDNSATVMDFGIAKMTTSTRLTATGQTMGTVRYMSPEQVRGQEVDVRTDIYSLGATLYESLVGDTPFDGGTHFEIMTKHLNEPPTLPSARGVTVPVGVETALMRSLAKKPGDRFATARDFRKALEAALKDADVGHAETLRMSRDSVPSAKVGAAPARAPAPTRPPPASAAAPATSAPDLDLSSKLEPDAAPPAGRKPWLWIGLATAVVAAGTAVLVITMRGESTKPRPPAAGSAPAPAGPFLPGDLTWAAQASFPGQALDVRCATACDPAAIAAVQADVVKRFAAFAGERHPGATLETRPITLLLVPQQVLCDPRTYETGEPPATCQREASYYRPIERTLLVVDDRARLPASLAAGVAEAICVHQPISGACDAIDAFVESAGKSGGPH
ncbi:MAG: serine/threonine protein kinase [Deltaproteobacteria bacterium]|nr:serine/threonine protein kinase [Deltaproteobacteria bacterium]